jgi:hypothetical protein
MRRREAARTKRGNIYADAILEYNDNNEVPEDQFEQQYAAAQSSSDSDEYGSGKTTQSQRNIFGQPKQQRPTRSDVRREDGKSRLINQYVDDGTFVQTDKKRTSFPVYVDNDNLDFAMKRILQKQIAHENASGASVGSNNAIDSSAPQSTVTMPTNIGGINPDTTEHILARLANTISSAASMSIHKSGGISRPKTAIIKNSFLSIDSRYRLRINRLSQGGFSFVLSTFAISTFDGTLGLQNQLIDVTEIEVMDSFIFPKKYTPGGTAYASTSYFNEVTLLLNELYSQSYQGPSNRYHFSFKLDPAYTDTMRYKLDIPYNSVFSFSNPVTFDRTLTFNFYTPTADANLDDDFFEVTIQYTNPATLTVAGPINQSTGNPITPNFTTGYDVVSFENFASSTYTYDSTNPLSVVYSEKFYPVTVVSPYVFTIPLDFTNPIIAQDTARPGTNVALTTHYANLTADSDNGATVSLVGNNEFNKFMFSGYTIYITGINNYDPVTTPLSTVSYIKRSAGFSVTAITYFTSGVIEFTINMQLGTSNPLYGPPGGDLSYVEFDYIVYSGGKTSPLATVRMFDGTRRIRFSLRFGSRVYE